MMAIDASTPTASTSSSIQAIDPSDASHDSSENKGWLSRQFLVCGVTHPPLNACTDEVIISSDAVSECGSEIQIIHPTNSSSYHSSPDLQRYHNTRSSSSLPRMSGDPGYASQPSSSQKPSRRREWLLRLSSLGRSSPSQTSVPTQVESPEVSSSHGPDMSPSRKGYFSSLGIQSCMTPPPRSDEIASEVETGEEKRVLLPPTPRVILDSADFLDFVLSCPGNRVEKITVKTVVERIQSSSDLRSDRKRLRPDNQQDDDQLQQSGHECHTTDGRRVSRYDEFELIQCPSAPVTLQMPPVILIPGGGIFYFWKAGFTMYLSQHFDLSHCIFMGTSAGALASIVTLVGENIAQASRLAIKMAMQRQVWDKSYFLAGTLHNLAGQWLERVIPKDVDVETLKHRLLVIAYRVSRVRLEGLCHFQSRQDLIECLLASIHIPFYANGRAATKARGMNYLDGSFGADIIKTFAQDVPSEKIVLIRCGESDYVTPIPRRECIRKLPPKAMLDLFHSGFAYAEKLHRNKNLTQLAKFETHPPGSFSTIGNPYLDGDRLDDDSLD